MVRSRPANASSPRGHVPACADQAVPRAQSWCRPQSKRSPKKRQTQRDRPISSGPRWIPSEMTFSAGARVAQCPRNWRALKSAAGARERLPAFEAATVPLNNAKVCILVVRNRVSVCVFGAHFSVNLSTVGVKPVRHHVVDEGRTFTIKRLHNVKVS